MIVMKFGGSSLGNGGMIEKAAGIIAGRLSQKPIVVVSAVGGVTDLLINSAKGVIGGDDPEEMIKEIRDRHLKIMNYLGLESRLIGKEIGSLSDLLRGIWLIKELTPRTLDLVMSFGERLSSRILTEYLKLNKIGAKRYCGWEAGILTDSNFNNAAVLPESYSEIQGRVGTDSVAVVTGFIAKDRAGEITTIGRGGSDLSAAIIGAAAGAEEIQIWTDVSGIMTADPRIVKTARTIDIISFEEAAELAYFGAKVLHPRTIEPAMQKDIPVRVLNTFRPEDAGTLIVSRSDAKGAITAVSSKRNITLLNCISTKKIDTPSFLETLFVTLNKYDFSVDMIGTTEATISLTLEKNAKFDRLISELREISRVSVSESRSIICVVGKGLKNRIGIAGEIFTELGKAGVNIELISQGSSEINISFVIKDEDVSMALEVLHKKYLSK
ncbi:MAG: aspartate kinase [archaeon]